MTVGVLGGGFGLYGYLPALLQHNPEQSVALLERVKERLLQRADVASLAPRVQWMADINAMLAHCSAMVLALPPTEQPAAVTHCLAVPSITHLLLEKPLAVSPAASQALLAQVRASGRAFRIGYNFRYTFWGQQLRKAGQGVQTLSWQFQAHHYTHNIPTWKRRHAEGGGALRFYGIHIIALLAELGYHDVLESSWLPGQAGAAWQAVFVGPALPTCRVMVNSDASTTAFQLTSAAGDITLSQPFEGSGEPKQGQDTRVGILSQLLAELFSDEPAPAWYETANHLWTLSEEKTNLS